MSDSISASSEPSLAVSGDDLQTDCMVSFCFWVTGPEQRYIQNVFLEATESGNHRCQLC